MEDNNLIYTLSGIRGRGIKDLNFNTVKKSELLIFLYYSFLNLLLLFQQASFQQLQLILQKVLF